MSATSRFLLEQAPGPLSMVQDLINTRPVPAYGVRDLFDTVTDARRWVSTVVPAWREATGAAGSPGQLSSADLPGLRRLRSDVEAAAEGRATPRRARTELSIDATGTVRVQPTGRGAQWLGGAVWGSVLVAQHDGTWDRLKTCRNVHCPCAFYDRSRNNARVWHDVRTCGNTANLRASRARRAGHQHAG